MTRVAFGSAPIDGHIGRPTTLKAPLGSSTCCARTPADAAATPVSGRSRLLGNLGSKLCKRRKLKPPIGCSRLPDRLRDTSGWPMLALPDGCLARGAQAPTSQHSAAYGLAASFVTDGQEIDGGVTRGIPTSQHHVVEAEPAAGLHNHEVRQPSEIQCERRGRRAGPRQDRHRAADGD